MSRAERDESIHAAEPSAGHVLHGVRVLGQQLWFEPADRQLHSQDPQRQ